MDSLSGFSVDSDGWPDYNNKLGCVFWRSVAETLVDMLYSRISSDNSLAWTFDTYAFFVIRGDIYFGATKQQELTTTTINTIKNTRWTMTAAVLCGTFTGYLTTYSI